MENPTKKIRDLEELAIIGDMALDHTNSSREELIKEYKYRVKKLIQGSSIKTIHFTHREDPVIETKNFTIQKQLDFYVLCPKHHVGRVITLDNQVANAFIELYNEKSKVQD